MYKDASGWGLKWSSGKTVFPGHYDSIDVLSKDLIKVQKDGLWGIINPSEKIVIPLHYEQLNQDQFGYYIKSNDLYGYISKKGDTIIEPQEHFLYTYEIGKSGDFLFLATNNDNKEAIFSSDGQQRTTFNYTTIIAIDSAQVMKTSSGHTNHYFALESVDEKYGIYDAVNKIIVVEPIYDDVCVTWCYQTHNPHLRFGVLLYTGNDPIFMMSKNNHPVVIRQNGDIFYENDTLSFSNYRKRYYLSQDGKLSEIEGKCKDQFDLPPPYIMQDDSGYFLINHDGSYFHGQKEYHEKISKGFYLGHKEGPYYYQIEDNGKVGITDSTGKWLLPQSYTDLRFVKSKQYQIFSAKKNGQYCYFDLNLNPIPEHPGLVIHYPKIKKQGDMYGVLSADSIWLIDPVFTEVYTKITHNSFGPKQYVFQRNDDKVLVYDTTFKLLNEFRGESFTYIQHPIIEDQDYLILNYHEKLSLYDLKTNKWILKNRDLVTKINGYYQHIDSTSYFFLRDEKNNLVVIDEKGEAVLTTTDSKKYNVTLQALKFGPHIVFKKSFYDENSDIHSVEFIINDKHSIAVDKDDNSSNYYLTYIDLSDIFILASVYDLEKEQFIYDSSFHLIRKEVGLFRNYNTYYCFQDFEKNECRFYGINDSLLKTTECNWIQKVEFTNCIYLSQKEKITLVNENMLYTSLREYRDRPMLLGRKGLFMVLLLNDESYRKVDVLNANGEVIIHDCRYVKSSSQFEEPKYFVFQTDPEELWLTEEGIIYHRNKLN